MRAHLCTVEQYLNEYAESIEQRAGETDADVPTSH